MTATLIDGTAIAADIRQKIAARVAELTAATGRKPGLATVLVGEDPASQAYVRMKGKNSLEAGMESFSYKLPATASQEEVEGLVRDLNANSAVNGILVQLPLPKHLDEEAILAEYPYLERQDIRAALSYAAALAEEEVVEFAR